MNDDLRGYVYDLFAEEFGSALMDVSVRFLPHQAFVIVQVRDIHPEMQEVARVVEAEFSELDRQVAVEVVCLV